MFDELARPQREGVTVENVTIGGVTGEWLDTHGADEVDRTIVWLHGGGYVLMSCATHRRLASGIALATGVPVFVPSYRLAPEHPFPAALDDAVAVVSELSSVSHQRKAIILGGDSAGGGLAVSTALRSRVEGINIAALALISPWVDLKRRRTPKAASSAPDPLVDVDELDEFAAMYAGADRDNSLVSPAFANLAGLPPMLIQVGSSETLLSDAGLLAARATEAGVAVRFEEWPAMVHVWHIFDGYLADADRALQQMADWILGI
jgi:acetyl esterase/lipase